MAAWFSTGRWATVTSSPGRTVSCLQRSRHVDCDLMRGMIGSRLEQDDHDDQTNQEHSLVSNLSRGSTSRKHQKIESMEFSFLPFFMVFSKHVAARLQCRRLTMKIWKHPQLMLFHSCHLFPRSAQSGWSDWVNGRFSDLKKEGFFGHESSMSQNMCENKGHLNDLIRACHGFMTSVRHFPDGSAQS